MATVKIVDMVDRVQTLIQDTSGTRWPKLELLKWFNDGQREIVMFRPDAKSVYAAFAAVEGTKQTLPSNALRLIGVPRNTTGKAITQIERRILDEQVPDWHTLPASPASAADHFVYEPMNPKVFWLYPRVAAATSVDIIYSAVPVEVTSADPDLADIPNTTIEVDDIYANAIMDYMMYRAYQKDANYAANGPRASAHYAAFQNGLGIRTQADAAATPVPAFPSKA